MSRLSTWFNKEPESHCYYCNKKLTLDNASIDHLTPRCRGGTSEKDNLVLCCVACNCEKDSMTEDEYNIYCQQKKEIINMPVNEIKIPYSFKNSKTRESKINKAVQYYKDNNKFDKPIILKSIKKKTLVDGYSRYIAAQALNIKEVPVTYAG